MVCDAALNPVQVCIVYLRDLVLFVFTVSTPAWPSVSLAVRLIHTTSDRHTVQAEFHSAIPASSQCSQRVSCSHLLSDSQYSLQLKRPYF